jgi:DNA-binding response OmpR family regulator
MRILVIEDNQDLAANIGDFFLSKQHTIDYGADGLTGLHLAATNDYDVVILDLGLPGIGGLDICRKLRKDAKKTFPILMLTARDTIEEKLEGYAAGCDDYLVKPFSLLELEARVNAIHQLFQGRLKNKILKVADLEYDPDTMILKRAGQVIVLKPTTLKILVELMKASHRVVTRAEIEEKIWGDSLPDGDALRAHIYAIRTAIDKNSSIKLLHTAHAVGYRLSADD